MKKPHCCNILALKTTTFRTKEIIKRKNEIIIFRTERTKTPPSLSLLFFYVCLSIPLLFSSSPPTVPSAFLFIFPSFFVYVSLSLPICLFLYIYFFQSIPLFPFSYVILQISFFSIPFILFFIFVVYFDQLLGAARIQKLVEQLFSAVFNLFCSF